MFTTLGKPGTGKTKSLINAIIMKQMVKES